LRYFSISHRIPKLFISSEIAEHMTWHHSYDAVDGVMVHPFDGEVWKQFNSVLPQFSMKSQNIYLGLSIDGFNTFESIVALYSYWSVILTTYNLQSREKYNCLSLTINLYVMHIKKNVFDNIFNTIMNMKRKIKDNMKVRINLALYCDHKNIKLIHDWLCVANPIAFFTLDNDA